MASVAAGAVHQPSSASEELRTVLATPPSTGAGHPPSSPSDPRQVAYAALQSLRDTGDPTFLFLRTLIELTSAPGGIAGPNEELAFHCVGGLRHVLLHRWSSYADEYRRCVRDWTMALGLGTLRSENAAAVAATATTALLPRTVSNSCLGCAASLWKRGWPAAAGVGEQTEAQTNADGATSPAVENAEAQSHLISMLASHPIYAAHRVPNQSELFAYVEYLLSRPLTTTSPPTSHTCSPHETHIATQATTFLSQLLGEISGTSQGGGYNQPVEFHRLVHMAFEIPNNGLDMTLRVAMTALGSAVRTLSNDGGSVPAQGVSQDMADLCCAIFGLTTDVLSWEFGGSNRTNFISGGDGPSSGGGFSGPTIIRPPERWREYIVRPDFLGGVFTVYTAVRDGAYQQQQRGNMGPLAHRIRQLLLMLSSVSGSVYENQEQRLAYASFLMEGCLKVLASLHEASVSGTGTSSAAGSANTAEEGLVEGETVDLCAMVGRLVANFRVQGLCQLPSFSNLLGAVAAVGNDLLQKSLVELQSVNGDFDMAEGTEWRDEALGHLLDAASLLADDPWLLGGGGEAAENAETTLASVLAPLYGSYVTVRTGMARVEEHFVTANAAELDEVREEISASTMDEEMTAASSLGRLNVSTSVASLASLLQQCLPRLQALFEASGGAGGGGGAEVTPDAAALLEEFRLLIVCTTHLLTDDNAGETPTIPDAIVRSCMPSRPDSAATTAAVADVVSSLMKLAEFQASKIAASPSDPRLSPLLGKTLLWFFNRWAPAYIVPPSLEHMASGQVPGGILGTWTSPDASSTSVTFCVTLCLHYHCYWPQESQVQEEAASLLLSLARRGKDVRNLMVHSASFEQLAAVHSVTASLRHNSAEAEVHAALEAAQSTVPEGMVRGYCRLPYGDRAKILTGLLVGSSEMGDEKAKAILEGCLTSVQSAFTTFVHAINKQVPAQDMNAKEMACLCIEMFGGIARASEMSEPERIPVFVTPSLKSLSDLMVYYADDLTICEILLRFFRDYAEQFIAMLTREQCLALFHASADLLKSYSAQHCTSRVVKRSASTLEADLEEEQNYSDVLCAIQLLIHLGTKDFIDICSTTSHNTVKSDHVTDVIFFGLKQILPLMTQGLLQFPTLCTQYFSLVGFMMDTYPDKVCALPYDLFRSLLDSLLFGMSHNDIFVAKSSLRGMSGIAREHLKSHALNGHLAHHADIIDTCSMRLMQEVVFQSIIWDRLEPSGMALLPLAAIDLNKFAAVVTAISNQFGSAEKQQRFQAAFQRLMKPEILSKISSCGYEGRMNRLKFKADFEEFVKDVHSFLLLK